LARITAPVLAITGGKDTHRIPDLTHVLRRTDGPGTVMSYRRLLREPVDADVLTGVARWLSDRLR
jgi:hypothetical protein